MGAPQPQFPQRENAGNNCARITGLLQASWPAALRKEALSPSRGRARGALGEDGGVGEWRAGLTKPRDGLREERDPSPRSRFGALLAPLLPKAVGEECLVPWLPLLSLPHPLSLATWHLCALTWGSVTPDPGAGAPGKVCGIWSPHLPRPGPSEQPTPLGPTAPGRQGGGAVSLRAFRLLGADGQADRGPLSFVWLCTKEGASWGGGSCSRWEGGALPLPLLTPPPWPLGSVFSLGCPSSLDPVAPTVTPKFLGKSLPYCAPLCRQKHHHTGGCELPLQVQGMKLPSLPPPPEQNLRVERQALGRWENRIRFLCVRV